MSLLSGIIASNSKIQEIPSWANNPIIATWDTVGTDYSDLVNATSFRSESKFTFSTGDKGIIFESGGLAKGLVLYIYDNKLYYRSGEGNGDPTLPTQDSFFYVTDVSTPLLNGQNIVFVENTLTLLKIWINGNLVYTSNKNIVFAGILSGASTGTIGQISGGVTAEHVTLNWTNNDIYSNTISYTRFY